MNKSDNTSEEDVSGWLLGFNDKNVDSPETLRETRSLRAEETRTSIPRVTMTGDTATVEDVAKLAQAAAAAELAQAAAAENEAAEESNGESATEAEGEEAAESEDGSGVWKWLKRGKGGPSKKKPGKLPPRADQGPTKDSRAAAADILREMQRRR